MGLRVDDPALHPIRFFKTPTGLAKKLGASGDAIVSRIGPWAWHISSRARRLLLKRLLAISVSFVVSTGNLFRNVGGRADAQRAWKNRTSLPSSFFGKKRETSACATCKVRAHHRLRLVVPYHSEKDYLQENGASIRDQPWRLRLRSFGGQQLPVRRGP